MKKVWKRIGKIALIVVVVIVILVAALLIYLSVTEYMPKDTEPLEVTAGTRALGVGDELTLLTYNTGYAGLDKSADFFMDGGNGVVPLNKECVEENLAGIAQALQSQAADIYLLQETDVNSDRTFHINEADYYEKALDIKGAFAYNYKCNFVPYPIPMIGHVESGLLTLSNFKTKSAERIALPVPFSWPTRTCNLKRCLLVEHIPLEGTDAELVLINLHLEAYDDGEGKKAQTEMLAKLLQSEYEKGNYVIAGGDFNQTFAGVKEYPEADTENWKPSLIDADVLPQGFTFVVDDSLPTCRILSAPYTGSYDTSQMYVIDGFIVSSNVTVKTVKTLDTNFEYSDHQPMMLQVTL